MIWKTKKKQAKVKSVFTTLQTQVKMKSLELRYSSQLLTLQDKAYHFNQSIWHNLLMKIFLAYRK